MVIDYQAKIPFPRKVQATAVATSYTDLGKQQIAKIAATAKRNCGCKSNRSFEARINSYWSERKARGFPVTVKTNYNTLRVLLKGEFSDDTLEVIAPFTGFTDVDLKKIARGEYPQQDQLEDLISNPPDRTMQVHSTGYGLMSKPSILGYFLLGLLERRGMNRIDFISRCGNQLSLSRIDEILDEGMEPTDQEYQFLAKGINSLNEGSEEGLTWWMLKQFSATPLSSESSEEENGIENVGTNGV